MKQLVCEMCGSKDLIKQDGVFVCQTCGCKYSVEEAKKMMVEGVVAVQGTVQIDKSNELDNYLQIIGDAFSDGRFDTVYSVIVNALSIAPEHPLLIARQGLAVLGRDGFNREIPAAAKNGMERAIKIAKDKLNAEDLREFGNALSGDIKIVCTAVHKRLDEEIREIESQKVTVMSDKKRAFNGILIALDGGTVTENLKMEKDNQNKLFNEKLDEKIWAVQNKKSTLNSFKTKCELDIRSVFSIAQEKVNELYWQEHASEKAVLDSEKEALTKQKEKLDQQIKDLEDKKNNVPATKELEEIKKKTRDLENTLSSLGVFKGKEKKALKEQIEQSYNQWTEVDKIVQKQQKVIDEEISPLRKTRKEIMDRIKEIDKELNTPR